MILKKNPADLDGDFLQGSVHLARRETTEAIQQFQTVLKLEPQLAQARYQLALAQLQAGNVQQAKTELRETTAIAPNFVEPTLLLAELNIQTGALQPAIEDLETLVAKEPRIMQAYPRTTWPGSCPSTAATRKALQLAQTAKDVAPEDAHTSDTLEWIGCSPNL